MKKITRMLKNKVARNLLLVTVIVTLLLVGLVDTVLAQDLGYISLTGATLAGRCNIKLVANNCNGRAGNAYLRAIRYLVVYVASQNDHGLSEGNLLTGDWSVNETGNLTELNAVLIVGWHSAYGPYTDKTAYKTDNRSACSVPPDYISIAWGMLGSYAHHGIFNQYNKPFLTLDGFIFGADWYKEEAGGFGNIILNGQISLKQIGEGFRLVQYNTKVALQVTTMSNNGTQVNPPYWSSWGTAKLAPVVEGRDFVRGFLPDYYFIDDWAQEHLGLDIGLDLNLGGEG